MFKNVLPWVLLAIVVAVIVYMLGNNSNKEFIVDVKKLVGLPVQVYPGMRALVPEGEKLLIVVYNK